MSHTPGPLSVSKHGTPSYAPQYGIYSDGCRSDLAIVRGDNAEADANLFAASPDLLKEAREFLDEFEAYINSDDYDLPDPSALREAIAKATGN